MEDGDGTLSKTISIIQLKGLSLQKGATEEKKRKGHKSCDQ